MTANDDEIGLETPDVDHLEQAQPLTQDSDGSDQPAGAVAGSAVGSVEADEADVLEQSIDVPVDDDYRDQ